MPLDWCGAQTQGTIGFTILDTLEAALAARGLERPVAALVTRTLVDPADPGFATPTKPIGRFLPHEQALPLIDHGETWQDRGEKGWRRVVASPEPLEVLETHTLLTLMAAGYVVVAAGGGGHPRGPRGRRHRPRRRGGDRQGPDRCAPRPGRAAPTPWSSPPTSRTPWSAGAPPTHGAIGRVSLAEMEGYAADGQFASGSMGPKVEAALRFVRAGGHDVDHHRARPHRRRARR